MPSKYLYWYCKQIDGFCSLSTICEHLCEKHSENELKLKNLKSKGGNIGYQTISYGIVPKLCHQEGKIIAAVGDEVIVTQHPTESI